MARSGKSRWRRVWLGLLLLIVGVPIGGVLLFAIVPPTPTILMVQQAAVSYTHLDVYKRQIPA